MFIVSAFRTTGSYADGHPFASWRTASLQDAQQVAHMLHMAGVICSVENDHRFPEQAEYRWSNVPR